MVSSLHGVSAVMPLGVAAGAVLAGTLLQLQQPRLLAPPERQALLAAALLLLLLAWASGRIRGGRRCPPSSSPALSERSRLMRLPGSQWPTSVSSSVSGAASTSKRTRPSGCGSSEITVRQTPAQAIEAPMAIVDAS